MSTKEVKRKSLIATIDQSLLEKRGSRDINLFSRIIKEAQVFVSDDGFCDEFGVSSSVVRRWVDGSSAPQDFAMPKILCWLRTQIMSEREKMCLHQSLLQASLYRNMALQEAFPHLLREILIFWSDREMADDMGYSMSSVRRWHKGVSLPHPCVMRVIVAGGYQRIRPLLA